MTLAGSPLTLCGVNRCRLPFEHDGNHDPFPTKAWGFMRPNDKKKLVKAGFATPRGGAKGAYQNHVVRSNQVIIPFEKYHLAPLDAYADGYVIRLLPEQYFESAGVVKSEFLRPNNTVQIGKNAFVLYRTHVAFKRFPPLAGWEIRHLEKGEESTTKRGKGVQDRGHYVLRISTASAGEGRLVDGAPQGLFRR